MRKGADALVLRSCIGASVAPCPQCSLSTYVATGRKPGQNAECIPEGQFVPQHTEGVSETVRPFRMRRQLHLYLYQKVSGNYGKKDYG